MIDLDPVYRMADEGEIRLMKSDVIQKVMEERFAEKDPAFTRFVESYAAGKQDDGLDALVLKLYEFSMSYPWPKQWLEECRAAYQIDSPEAVQKSIWVQELMTEAKKRLSSILEGIEENRKTAVSPGGPYLYDEALASDQQMVEELIETESFDGMVRAMAGMKFKALSRKKADDVSEARKDQVKAERDACKKELQKLKEQFFEKDSAEIAEEIADCREPIGVLIDLTEQFASAFAEKKRSKNILDYADLEHFALEILVQQEDGRLVRTDAARELSEQFREIMIDEYQDSNFIQEALLSAVSGEEEGRWNRFMVGDIKQSIYGFRLARPELFLEKYHTYQKDGESQQRIDLDKNFRSRPEVLATANYVFRKLMSPELGGIAYDEAASLHPGAAFPALPEMEEKRRKRGMRHMKQNFCCWMTRRPSWKMISRVRQRWKRRRLPLRRASARWSEMRKSWTKRPGNTGNPVPRHRNSASCGQRMVRDVFARPAGGGNSGVQHIKNGILFHAGNRDGAELSASVRQSMPGDSIYGNSALADLRMHRCRACCGALCG